MKLLGLHPLTAMLTMVVSLCIVADLHAAAIPKLEPVVAFKGSWEDMGRQTAYYFPETIIQGALIFSTMLRVSGQEAQAYYDQIAEQVPQGVQDQMQGIALGLSENWMIPYNMAWDMVLVWNLGIDIYAQHKMEAAGGGCTAFAVSSSAGTFLCHNTDNQPGTESMGAAIWYQPDNGENAFLSFFSPGFVGVGLGVNDQGLAITYNVGRPNKSATIGLPALFMSREMMAKAGTLDEAIAFFDDYLDRKDVFSHQGANFLLVDFKDNSMARIQLCSDQLRVTYGQLLKEGVTYVSCTNHFDDDFSPSPEDTLQDSSHQRFARLMEILPRQETYDLQACWDVLSDRGAEGTATDFTICRDGSSTDTTLGNIFTAEAAYYALGRTCDYLEVYGEAQAIPLDRIAEPSVRGTVNALSRPLAQAQVVLQGISSQGVELKTYTAKDGTFSFNNLEPGSYILLISKFMHMAGIATVEYNGQEAAEIAINLVF